jgi:hypothetical protein
MRKSGPNPLSISDLLGQGNATLERLRAGARAADRTLEATRGALEPEVREHVWGAVLEADRLVVLVDSAGWATRVRYAGPELRAGVAAALGKPVKKLAVRVRPR